MKMVEDFDGGVFGATRVVFEIVFGGLTFEAMPENKDVHRTIVAQTRHGEERRLLDF